MDKKDAMQSTKNFEKEQRKKVKLQTKLWLAQSPKERSISPTNSRSPTLKEYKKYLFNESPPFLTTDKTPYLLNEKISYLKNDDIDNTKLQLTINQLPRSYKDEKNTIGLPYVSHAGIGRREFKSEITDPLFPVEDRTNITTKNKFLQSVKRDVFSSTAQLTLKQNQTKFNSNMLNKLNKQKEQDKKKRFIMEQKIQTAPKWNPTYPHREYFTDLQADDRVIVRDKDGNALAKQFILREKQPFRIPKIQPNVFKMEKTYVE